MPNDGSSGKDTFADIRAYMNKTSMDDEAVTEVTFAEVRGLLAAIDERDKRIAALREALSYAERNMRDGA